MQRASGFPWDVLSSLPLHVPPSHLLRYHQHDRSSRMNASSGDGLPCDSRTLHRLQGSLPSYLLPWL